MAITEEDINLKNFLKKFTYTQDPNSGNKIVLDTALFLQICSLLKIDFSLSKLAREIRG